MKFTLFSEREVRFGQRLVTTTKPGIRSTVRIFSFVLLITLAVPLGWFAFGITFVTLAAQSKDLTSVIGGMAAWVTLIACLTALYAIAFGRQMAVPFKLVIGLLVLASGTVLVFLAANVLQDIISPGQCRGFFGSPSTCVANAWLAVMIVSAVACVSLSPVALAVLWFQLRAWAKQPGKNTK